MPDTIGYEVQPIDEAREILIWKYHSMGEVMTDTTYLTYHQPYQVILNRSQWDEQEKMAEYEYDNCNRLLSEKMYLSGKLSVWMENQYNDEGMHTGFRYYVFDGKECDWKVEYQYLDFDEQGNWIRRIETNNFATKRKSESVREIVYYE